MIRLKFPPHFQDRIQERGIDVDHIRKAINAPDFTKETFQHRVLVRKLIDEKRTIEVVYFKDGFKDSHDYIIVTAYYINL